ncbi:hypothetical protein ACOMHN_022350 [Nucella lapillus]
MEKKEVQVTKHNVHITLKHNSAFAIVDHPDLSVSRHLLSQLSSIDNVHKVFDLSKITFDPRSFKVGPNLNQGHWHMSRSRSNEKNGIVSVPVGRESDTAQPSSSNPSVESPGSYRSIPRSNRRNSGGGEMSGTQSTSSTVVTSSSDQSAGKPAAKKKITSTQRQRKRKRLLKANGSHPSSSANVLLDPSNNNRQIRKPVNAGHISEEDEDSSMSESDTASSPESFTISVSVSKGNSSGTSLHSASAKPQAGGILRVVQELGVDSLPRSASERGIGSLGKSTTTSITDLPPPKVSVTTSTPGAGAGLVSNFYRLGQTIGRETRHIKWGTTSDLSRLVEIVGKYVCGFLNSGDGGTLYFGVNDDGLVIGIPYTQAKKDSYRKIIDQAFKSIDPPVFTDVYTVRFIPLMKADGYISEKLLVLEVEVKEARISTQLYVFRDNAFLRLDGSLQGPLKARQVQELTRRRLERNSSSSVLKSHLHEVTSKMESEREKTTRMQQQLTELEGRISERLERNSSSIVLKSHLHEVTSKMESEREKTTRMQQQLTELEGRISEVNLERNKSRICAVM